MAIAKVEPLTTARALRGPFDYLLSDRFSEVEVGTVLRVPFGPRRILGVVVEIAERSALDPERLAEPVEALGQQVVIRAAQGAGRGQRFDLGDRHRRQRRHGRGRARRD